MTTTEIEAALRKRYAWPEWAIFFEVANGTGSNARRRADCITMNMYPSRGLAIHGFEIKVSRGDLARELAEPAKADEVARYCDFWTLAVPKGLVKDTDHIPFRWGVLEVDDKGGTHYKKSPEKLTSDEPNRGFIAAMLRRASEVDMRSREDEVRRRAEAMNETYKANMAKRLETQEAGRMERERYEKLRQQVNEFERRTGLNISGWSGPEASATTVKALLTLGMGGLQGRLNTLVQNYQQISTQMEALRTLTADLWKEGSKPGDSDGE